MRNPSSVLFVLLILSAACKKEPEIRESMLLTLSVRDRYDNDLLDTGYVGHFPWSLINWNDPEGNPLEFRITRKYGAFLLENTSKLRDVVEYEFIFPDTPVQKVRFEFADYRMTDRQTNRELIIRSIAQVWWNGEPLKAEHGYFKVTINP